MAAEDKGPKINLDKLKAAIEEVVNQLSAIPEAGLTERQSKYKQLKLKQLAALRELTRTAMCPETWSVWPPEP